MGRALTVRRRFGDGIAIHVALLVAAAVGWWWSARMAVDMTAGPMADHAMDGHAMGSMSISFFAFLVAWLAMMTAMMFPAVGPVVKLYARAATAGRVAPLPFFVAGYIGVWTSLGIPAYLAWRAIAEPLAVGEAWVARVAGVVLLAAAVWQLTPLKAICLRHCRSPMSVFLRASSSMTKASAAIRAGLTHGTYCVGCCWALMAVLVALGTMNLAWMLGLAVLIMLEKNAPAGEWIARAGAVAFAVVGVWLLVRPDALSMLT